MTFMPPYADRLKILAEKGEFRAPARCHVHVGAEDWQSNPESVLALASLTGIGVTVVPGAEHMLGKEYVGAVLDEWLQAG